MLPEGRRNDSGVKGRFNALAPSAEEVGTKQKLQSCRMEPVTPAQRMPCSGTGNGIIVICYFSATSCVLSTAQQRAESQPRSQCASYPKSNLTQARVIKSLTRCGEGRGCREVKPTLGAIKLGFFCFLRLLLVRQQSI